MSGDIFPVLIAEWPRNARDIIRVYLDEYQGNAVVNLRAWYPTATAWMPGKGGLTIGVRHLPRLHDAIAKALAEARGLNLLPPAD